MAKGTERIKAEIAALHRDALVIDSHNDTIVAHIRRGNCSYFDDDADSYDPSSGEAMLKQHHTLGTIVQTRGPEQPRPGAAAIQINFPKMRQGGIDAAFFAIDVHRALSNHLAYALDGFGYFMGELDSHDGEVVIVKRTEDIRQAKAEGKLAALLAIEHADCVEGSLNVLRMLHEIGVRSIGLTHNKSSLAADGCLEAREGVGLTRFGVELVREMNRLGMLVDLAHVSPGAFYHALEVSTKPVIFSHGNAKALCDHARNLDDRQLKALAEVGGVIGMSYVRFFVDTKKPTVERLLDHVEHICDVAGVEVVGLGSDFDGGGTLLSDALETPRITEGLLKRGFNEEQIRKVLGENTLRVLEATIG